MRILRLKLMAFGHFTNAELDFSATAGKVHLVYGPNEAGKSTVLRALRGLLYGIESRSPDGFLHDYDHLRIGARVRLADGSEIEFIRRKGTRNTFLDAGGMPADEEVLRTALQAVDEDMFTSLFGIDHDQLVAGGRAILQGGGDVGQSLFAAGLGGASLRSVIDQLESEASQLFKPRGKDQGINRGCSDYKEQKDKIAEYSVPSRDFEERAAALDRTKADRDLIAARLSELRTETSRLERIARALPHLPARRALRLELEQLGVVPFLPESFTSQRLSSLATLSHGRAQILENEQKLRELDAQIAALPPSENLVSRAGLITELHQRLGSHRKAARELPALDAERRALETDIEQMLADLQLSDADSTRLSRPIQRQVQTLAGQHQALVERTAKATRTHENLVAKIQAGRKESLALPAVAALRDALKEAQRHGDLEDEWERQSLTLRAAEAAAGDALKRLGLWSGTLGELTALAMPAAESIDRFEADWSFSENALQQAAARLGEIQSGTAEREREIEELLRAGSVPTEAELAAARARREEKWRSVREALRPSPAGPADRAPEAEAYEAEVQNADDLADRLRREAARVTQHAHLTADRDLLVRQARELQAESARQETAFAELRARWRALWSPLEPLPPREMRAWRPRCDRLLDQAGDLRMRVETIATTESRIARHRAALAVFLPGDAEKPLRVLLDHAQQLLQRTDDSARDAAKLAADLAAAESDKQDAEASFAHWQSEWSAAMGKIGREEKTNPPEAHEFINDCAEVQRKFSEVERLRVRIKAVHSEAEAFKKEAAETYARFSPEGPAPEAEEAVIDLYDRLTRANRHAATRAACQDQRTATATALEAVRAGVQAEEFRLNEMCQLAGCDQPAQLESIEEKSRLVQAKRARLGQLEERIQSESAGVPLDDFIASIEALDADALSAQIPDKQREMREAEEQRSALDKQFGAEELLFKTIDGNPRAAEAADNALAILGKIEEHTEHFIRLRLASAILRREIERYRAENQDPLLKRAGEIFSVLTLGSFSGVTTDFDARDEPILKGLRASGPSVAVEGMSEGTRDQLFLALRLASVEKFLTASGPMPFIVDDILIAFDQQREAAVLQVLANLAKKTQVMIFTHHRHLVDLTRKILADAVEIHEIGVTAA